MQPAELKERVRDHWEHEVCGSRYGAGIEDRRRYFDEVERTRYEQDYMLPDFARFGESRGLRVLEIGLGTGTDFVHWARAGASAFGRDLTEASVALVKERLQLEGLTADVARGDAEKLDFPDNFFDLYYSWGVLHHTPNTQKAIAEAWRVLKPGGTLKIMLYHHPSVATFLVWMLYGPMRLRLKSVRECCAEHVESPGTQVFSARQARAMVGRYFRPESIEVRTYLGSGDLLSHKVSDKYRGPIWGAILKVYPRWFVKHILGHRLGSVMTIKGIK